MLLHCLLLACSPGPSPGPSGPGVTTNDSNATDSGGRATGSTSDTGPTSRTGLTGLTGDTGHTGGTADTGACTEPGCLVSYESLGRFDRSDLQPYVVVGPPITTGYEVFTIEYLTEGSRVATGTVTLPIDPLSPAPVDGWPTVVNNHGTIGVSDDCRLSGTVSGSGLAGLFGARGAIGVAPDYVGLGGPGDHHYLDLYDEAVSVLDSVRAAHHLAAAEGVASSGRTAVVGLSQGGHATLAAATWHSRYAPELDIRAFAASGPASVYEEQWRDGVQFPGSHMALHALLAWSFAQRTGNDDDPLWAEGFDPEPHLTSRCGWDPDFTGEPTLYDDFPTTAAEVFHPDYLGVYVDGSFTGFDFVAERFEANRIVPWLDDGDQTAPIAVWQGTDDTVVPLVYTRQMVTDLQDGGIDITLHEVPGGEHTTTAFGFLASVELATDESLSWVFEQLE